MFSNWCWSFIATLTITPNPSMDVWGHIITITLSYNELVSSIGCLDMALGPIDLSNIC